MIITVHQKTTLNLEGFQVAPSQRYRTDALLSTTLLNVIIGLPLWFVF